MFPLDITQPYISHSPDTINMLKKKFLKKLQKHVNDFGICDYVFHHLSGDLK